jgi:transcription elongation factor Elf1
MPLTPEQQREAMRQVGAWRARPTQPVACPACGADGLGVVDRSARPHAEWYALSCAACGLDETLHIPMGAATPTLD